MVVDPKAMIAVGSGGLWEGHMPVSPITRTGTPDTVKRAGAGTVGVIAAPPLLRAPDTQTRGMPYLLIRYDGFQGFTYGFTDYFPFGGAPATIEVGFNPGFFNFKGLLANVINRKI